MPVAAFTFGSFGDIVTIIELVVSLRNVLSESGDSGAEYKALLSYLESFTYSLECLKPLLSTQSGSSPIDSSAINAIRYAVACCEVLIREFKAKLGPPSSGEISTNTAEWFRNIWWKLQWASATRHDAVELRSRLKAQGDIINRILSMSTLAVHRRQCITSSFTFPTMALVSLANRELSTHLPPTPMNHTIAVIDILDQTTQVPMELCSTPEIFRDYLNLFYRNRAGHALVKNGHFILTTAGDGRVVNDTTWRCLMKPGATINMSATFLLSKLTSRQCPRCLHKNYPSVGQESSADEILCFYCHTYFRVVSQRSEYIVVDNPAVKHRTSSKRQGASSPFLDDMQFLRRITAFAPSEALKRALLVTTSSDNELDVDRVRKGLTDRYGFENDNITVLSNTKCDNILTREIILNAVQRLTEVDSEGDQVLFHFSGRTEQQANAFLEADGLDEFILPADYDPQMGKWINDEDIGRMLIRSVPIGPRVTATLDAIHSRNSLNARESHGSVADVLANHSAKDSGLMADIEEVISTD
ncbi:unnamed protein product [Somion occarium]|uniref:Ubiquitin-like domain-containing protein n=1 Tax=Somion occarium TaxID=3059160 RepID=A0ABP1CX00_9APHY